MAVIKNQKTGMWEVRTYYKDWTGTRRQKTKRGFAKKSEAQEYIAHLFLSEYRDVLVCFGRIEASCRIQMKWSCWW